MNCSSKIILLIVLAVCYSGVPSGCMTQKSAELLSYEIVRGYAGDASEIPFWTESFQSDKHRWPKDFQELRDFVSKISKGRLKLQYYDSVSFEEVENGRLYVSCFHNGNAGMKYTLLPEDQRQQKKTSVR